MVRAVPRVFFRKERKRGSLRTQTRSRSRFRVEWYARWPSLRVRVDDRSVVRTPTVYLGSVYYHVDDHRAVKASLERFNDQLPGRLGNLRIAGAEVEALTADLANKAGEVDPGLRRRHHRPT